MKNQILPNFYIIGFSKCGTTSLSDYLSKIPDCFMSTPKEPNFHFWQMEKQVGYKRSLDSYLSLFTNATSYLGVGEASVCYLDAEGNAEAARSIFKMTPDAKLIVCVRNPILRTESIWREVLFQKMNGGLSWTKGKVSYDRISEDFSDVVLSTNILEQSLFWKTLQPYFERFPKEHIKILFFEDMVSDYEQFYAECCNFLGLPNNLNGDQKDATVHSNRSSSKRILPSCFHWCRQIKCINMLIKYVPPSVMEEVRRKVKKPIPEASWNEEAFDKAIEYFKEDSAKLLCYCNKPHDFWDVPKRLLINNSFSCGNSCKVSQNF